MDKASLIILLFGMMSSRNGIFAQGANTSQPEITMFCPSRVMEGSSLSMMTVMTLPVEDAIGPQSSIMVLTLTEGSLLEDVIDVDASLKWWKIDSNVVSVECAHTTEPCGDSSLYSVDTSFALDLMDNSTVMWLSEVTIDQVTQGLSGTYAVEWSLNGEKLTLYTCAVTVESSAQIPPSPVHLANDHVPAKSMSSVTYLLAKGKGSLTERLEHDVKYFHLEVIDEGNSYITVYKEAYYETDNDGSPVLRYTIWGLEPSSQYWVQLKAVGHNGKESTSGWTDFHTPGEIIRCQEEVDDGGLVWQSTLPGTVQQACPSDYTGFITRRCLTGGVWEDRNDVGCRKVQLTNIEEQITEITDSGAQPTQEQIAQISSSLNDTIAGPDPVLSGDIVQVVNILDDVATVVDISDDDILDTNALENFANAADTILSTDDSKWKMTTDETTGIEYGSKLVLAVDKLAVKSLNDPNYSTDPIVKQNVVIKRDRASLEDIVFPEAADDAYDKYDGWVTSSGNKLLLSAKNFDEEKDIDSINYAIVLFNGVDSKFAVNSDAQKSHSEGRALKNLEVSSDVMAFSLSKEFEKFSSPLRLQFEIRKVNNTDPVCGYLDETLGSVPIWSSEGCRTITNNDENEENKNIVTCQCDHLTNFAILMTPHGIDSDDKHHDILTIVTYVGCGISIVCLIATIVIHVITWKYVKENRTILHVNLSLVLILAYAVFLAGVDRTENDTVCTVVAVLLHFLFLAVFFIMLMEGIQIFMTITFVFSRDFPISIMMIIAYCFPIAIVGATYGVMDTDEYRDGDFCWLNVDSYALWTFAGPALFVILVNCIIMCITMRTMLNTVAMKSKDAKAKAKSAMRAVFVLSPIFGVTWVFGVLAVNDSLVVFQYLFAVFNTLQGLFVFLFHCLFSTQIRDGLQHLMRKRRSRSFGASDQMFNNNKTSSNSRNLSTSSQSDNGPTSPQTERSGFEFPQY